MTREELFKAYPRPWRLGGDGFSDTIVDANGHTVFQADPDAWLGDEDASAVAGAVLAIVNEAGQ